MKKRTLFNIKGAGRPAIHDRGIRHIARDEIKRLTVLHLTVKIEKAKAGLKNKTTLQLLRRAILKARKMGLSIVHYTLEFDHVHMLVETNNNETLARGMQSFGITLSKGINKIKATSGQVFKTRYHFRKLKTPSEIKNALAYILGNGIKHKSSSFINQYNTLMAVKNYGKLYPGFESKITDVIKHSMELLRWKEDLQRTLASPQSFLLSQLV